MPVNTAIVFCLLTAFILVLLLSSNCFTTKEGFYTNSIPDRFKGCNPLSLSKPCGFVNPYGCPDSRGNCDLAACKCMTSSELSRLEPEERLFSQNVACSTPKPFGVYAASVDKGNCPVQSLSGSDITLQSPCSLFASSEACL